MVYLILGTALDGISMIVLTDAVVLPMIQKAGFDLVWFGIFIVLLVEIAEVTPPVGFNLFVLQNMTGKRQQHHRARGAPVLRLPGDLHRADHRVPGDRDLAAGADAALTVAGGAARRTQRSAQVLKPAGTSLRSGRKKFR